MFYKTDAVIIGSGLAGLYTALNMPRDWHITLLSSYEDNSSLAQGGVASCMSIEDSFASHYEDTMTAGHHLNDSDAVDFLVKNGPRQIMSLTTLGVHFDTYEDGSLKATLEGGHSFRRILHVDGDRTGDGIMKALKAEATTRSNIHWLQNSKLIELVKHEDEIIGVRYQKGSRLRFLSAGYTILATGGLGDLYDRTTNRTGAIGTGIALAHQAGAECRDMRFVQFHPTAFYMPGSEETFLISEAVRGEGAYLLNEKLERFMTSYDSRLELAPRDVVSKAIFNELANQTKPYVYLDTRHMNKAFFSKRFPGITEHLKQHHILPGKDLIPVSPVAHYTIGGIQVDQVGKTTLGNLYACGEVTSSGVHGANRLASNSLLECLVYGDAISGHLRSLGRRTVNEEELPHQSGPKDFRTTTPNTHAVRYIQKAMTATAGIQRYPEDCRKLINEFTELKAFYEKRRYKDWGSFYIYTMLYNALLILKDATDHPSMGCHHLLDTSDTAQKPSERKHHDRTYEHTTA